jgi:hypothetical protein
MIDVGGGFPQTLWLHLWVAIRTAWPIESTSYLVLPMKPLIQLPDVLAMANGRDEVVNVERGRDAGLYDIVFSVRQADTHRCGDL